MTESELLFSEILGCSRTDLYLNQQNTLQPAEASRIASALKHRIKGEPLEYILGSAEFMGLKFKLSPDVLIPRPETEILVEKAIDLASCAYYSEERDSLSLLRNSSSVSLRGAKRRSNLLDMKHKRIASATSWPRNDTGLGRCVKILDLGTGSGCIAIALAKFLPHAQVTAIDISGRAIAIARQNAELNNLDITRKIKFIHADFFSRQPDPDGKFDIIVSNPPYIATDELAGLQSEVCCQPREALDGGKDGLEFYRRIAKIAPQYLKFGGLLVMEVGFGQRKAIEQILESRGIFQVLEVVKDYNNIERVMVVKRVS